MDIDYIDDPPPQVAPSAFGLPCALGRPGVLAHPSLSAFRARVVDVVGIVKISVHVVFFFPLEKCAGQVAAAREYIVDVFATREKEIQILDIIDRKRRFYLFDKKVCKSSFAFSRSLVMGLSSVMQN